MEYVIVLAVTFVIVGVVLAWAWVHWRRTRRSTRDDLVRAGDDVEVSPYRASRRAEGEAAWARIGGGA